MKSDAIDNLFKNYSEVSPTHLSADQFGTLLTFFPALLVIASDGVIDDDEWVYVKYLAKFMAENDKDTSGKNQKELQKQYFNELKYLLESLMNWEEKFIDTLADYLMNYPEIKEDIEEILHMFAEASEGESEIEEETIASLSHKLGLEGDA